MLERPKARLCGRIHERYPELLIEVDDGVHGVVDQEPELGFALLGRALGPESQQLGGGAVREDPKDGHAARLCRHGLVVQHGQRAR